MFIFKKPKLKTGQENLINSHEKNFLQDYEKNPSSLVL